MILFYSLNLRLIDSTTYNDKLNEIINIISNPNNDIICFQGINNDNSLKKITKIIEQYNISNNKLSTYPQINTANYSPSQSNKLLNVMKLTWNNIYDIESCIDCLIITKHNIINGTKIEISDNDNNNNKKYCLLININFKGTIISVYNCDLEDDLIGISLSESRKHQISKLVGPMALSNIDHINKHLIKYKYLGIHVLCCQTNISELHNNRVNPEYIHLMQKLNALDTYRYVQLIKKIKEDITNDSTTINKHRTNYILLIQLNTASFQDVLLIGKYLNDNHKILITNSIINKNTDIFEDYPSITTFVLFKN